MADVKYFADLLPVTGGEITDARIMAMQSDPKGTAGWKPTLLQLKDYFGLGSSTPIDLTTQLAAGGVTAFTIPEALDNPSKSSLYYNGNRQIYGINYTISGTTLTWIPGAYPLFALGSDDGVNSFWLIPTISLLPFTQLPAFKAEVNVTHTNVTGDGTPYTVLFQNDSTGDFYDLQNNYNPATGQYTATFDQIFNYGASTFLKGVTALNDVSVVLMHRNSGGTEISNYPCIYVAPDNVLASTSDAIFSGSTDFKLAIGDTVECVVTGLGEVSKNISIFTTGSQFYGHAIREI